MLERWGLRHGGLSEEGVAALWRSVDNEKLSVLMIDSDKKGELASFWPQLRKGNLRSIQYLLMG